MLRTFTPTLSKNGYAARDALHSSPPSCSLSLPPPIIIIIIININVYIYIYIYTCIYIYIYIYIYIILAGRYTSLAPGGEELSQAANGACSRKQQTQQYSYAGHTIISTTYVSDIDKQNRRSSYSHFKWCSLFQHYARKHTV